MVPFQGNHYPHKVYLWGSMLGIAFSFCLIMGLVLIPILMIEYVTRKKKK